MKFSLTVEFKDRWAWHFAVLRDLKKTIAKIQGITCWVGPIEISVFIYRIRTVEIAP